MPEVAGKAVDAFEARIREHEERWLSPLAVRSYETRGRLREEGSPYHSVLASHLGGAAQDRQKLWIARKKLVALIRDEIARTCSSQDEFQEEVRYLSPFLAKGPHRGAPSGRPESPNP